ncbi:MAG: peptide deformylase [Candidatus Omnitrophica bacterium]|nr:peptide deformylase [Candidatus Omnitrophota bacterium]
MNATALEIRIVGDPALRKKAKRVSRVGPGHAKTLSDMARQMYDSKGIGLAAPQVGINECLIVVDIGTGLYKLINPRIVRRQGRQELEEGCLSVPGVYLKVRRARKIRVEALDETGAARTIDAEDLLACVFQHEIDHLEGKLIIDYASFLEKLSLNKKLRNIKNERLSEPQGQHTRL